MRKYLAVAIVALGMIVISSRHANAAVLTFENPGLLIFQQTENSPCVIGEPSCNQPDGFGVGIIPTGPAGENYDVDSPDYTVAQIEAIVGSSFFVGIDVNTAAGQPIEVLQFFGMYVNDVLIDSFSLGPGGEAFALTNNGNGFSDALLRNFSSLSLFLDTDLVHFQAIVTGATDGREQFFLISSGDQPEEPPVIPEPGSLMLLGSGLLIGARRLRQRFMA
jgi:hypothetical protein